MNTSSLSGEAPPESARRQKTRTRLLDAAFEVFAEYGVHAASVEMVTEAAGFTRGAFYSNFSSKEELFISLMEREKTMRIAQLNAGLERFVTPVLDTSVRLSDDKVIEIISSVLALQSGDRRWLLVQTEFQLLAMRDPEMARGFLDYQEGLFHDLTAIVVAALRSASRRFTIEPEQAVRVIAEVSANAETRAMIARDERTFSERLSATVPAVVLALIEHV